MTDQTAERALLRDVLRWARANGWVRDRIGPCGREPGSKYWEDDRGTTIGLDRHNWLNIGGMCEVEVVNLRCAVDVLAALGVLPARFSSAYAAGWEAAGTVSNAAEAMRRVTERRLERRTQERDAAYAAGRASVLDEADVTEQWSVRAAPGAPISPLIYPTPEAALESCVVPGDTVWHRVVVCTPWQPAPGAEAGREEENR